MKKFFLIVFLLFFIFYFSSSVALALENFTTAYDVTYTVREDESTHVLFNIILTNTTSQYYASTYKIRLGFTNISNIKASDPGGPIIPVITESTTGKSISLTFNKKAVGLDNKIPFTLSFDTNEIAQKQGEIWEINIPGLTNQGDFADFTVHVRTPSNLGEPIYIKPEQNTSSLDFTKEQLGKSGISMAFGESQYYAFNLVYHLKNNQFFPIKTEIALPPTTNYQDVVIESINPPPLSVQQDTDGNWLALYALSPTRKIDVIVKGKVQIFLTPKKEELSQDLRLEYTKEQPFWEANDDIKALARRLKTPENIYNYVITNVTYDFSRVTNISPRLGAAAVLANPTSAVCLEFTDLFIALARSAGIPARQVDGFAYTQNAKQRPLTLVKDILHSWPEYYDDERQAWIMVDPTWGNTTRGIDYFNMLDFDHFAFIIKGKSSVYPIPAGGYKLKGQESTKDISVSFTNPFLTNTKSAITIQRRETSSTKVVGLKLIGGVFIAGLSIIILIIAASARYLPFFRRKR